MVPRRAALSRALRRALWAIVLAGVADFAAAVPRRQGDPQQSLWLDVVVFAGVYVGVALLLLTVPAPDRSSRQGLRLLGLAVLTSAAGNLVYSLVVARQADPPYPSVADVWFLLWYPLSYLGVLSLIRARARRLELTLAVDGLTAGIAASAVVLALVLGDVLQVAGADRAEVLVNLAYPVGDLLLVFLVVAGGTIIGRGVSTAGLALGSGMTLMAVADVLFIRQDAAGTYTEGGWLDLLWLLAVLPLAAAGTPPAGRTPDVAEDPAAGRPKVSSGSLVVPVLSVICCVVLIVGHQVGSVPESAVLVADAGLVAGLVRGWLTYREMSRATARELERFRRQARTDDLTGLPNRRALHEYCHDRIDAAGTLPELALLLLDLDRFKEINDALGHAVGDELLRDVAERVTVVRRPGDVLFRLGGDEFAVVVEGTATEGRRRAELVLQALSEPFLVDGAPLHVEASVGVAAMPGQARTLGELLQYADLAMYEAKRTRRGVVVHAADSGNDRRDRLRTIEDLRAALNGANASAHGHLLVHLQPQVALDPARKVVGVEALVRWQHPVEGLLPPGAFLPLAGAVGLLGQLTDVVLDLALDACQAWWRDGFAVPVSVNVAATDLHEPALVARIDAALERHRLPGQALVVEITEDSLMVDPGGARAVLERLRRRGVGVSIDDYGSGYSSLAYLRDLPADELKLDLVFTRDLARDPWPESRAAAIVRTTTDLAHSLGLRIVAEGIDDEAVVGLLDQLGVDVGQGYHLARPMPAENLLPWLRERAAVSEPVEAP